MVIAKCRTKTMLHPTWSRDTFLSKRTGQVCLQTNWKNISTFQQPSLFFIACWTSTTFFKKSGIRAFFLVDVCGVQIFLGHQTWLTPRVGIELTRSYKPHLWGICNCCRGTKFRWEKRYLGKKHSVFVIINLMIIVLIHHLLFIMYVHH